MSCKNRHKTADIGNPSKWLLTIISLYLLLGPSGSQHHICKHVFHPIQFCFSINYCITNTKRECKILRCLEKRYVLCDRTI